MPFDWHTDGGASLREFRVEPDSRPLNFKIQYFLTDIPADNRANFCFRARQPSPGLSREGFRQGSMARGRRPASRRGRRCCHLHLRPVARRGPERGRGRPAQRLPFATGSYGPRPWDYEKAPPEVLARMTPRQRRLMGDIGPNSTPGAYYAPADQLDIILDGIE